MPAQLAPRLRVVVADDHDSIRENLRYLLNSESDLECVDTVKHPVRCVDICLEIGPDVLVYTFELDACNEASAAGVLACVAKDGPYELLLRAIRAARPQPLPV